MTHVVHDVTRAPMSSVDKAGDRTA